MTDPREFDPGWLTRAFARNRQEIAELPESAQRRYGLTVVPTEKREPLFINPTNRKPFKTLVNISQNCSTAGLWKAAGFLMWTACKRMVGK